MGDDRQARATMPAIGNGDDRQHMSVIGRDEQGHTGRSDGLQQTMMGGSAEVVQAGHGGHCAGRLAATAGGGGCGAHSGSGRGDGHRYGSSHGSVGAGSGGGDGGGLHNKP